MAMTSVTLYNWITVDGVEWGVHLWGELEEYEDGTRQVVDIEARYLLPDGAEQLSTDGNLSIPQEVQDLAQALLDDHRTSDDMLEHGAIH
jgi:hypothetical protein